MLSLLNIEGHVSVEVIESNLHEHFFRRVFSILIQECGADPRDEENFVYSVSGVEGCHEYRFQGKLGFGGKYWTDSNQVSMYDEDQTPERVLMRRKAQKRLDYIKDELYL